MVKVQYNKKTRQFCILQQVHSLLFMVKSYDPMGVNMKLIEVNLNREDDKTTVI